MSTAGDCDQFQHLLNQVQNGCDDAARQLFELYSEHIYRSIRRRLSRELRSKFDSDDFAQAVWASFFTNREAVVRFRYPEELIAFLARVASNKVVDECRRRFATAKHNVTRERSLEQSAAVTRQSLLADTPRPSQIVTAREQWEQLTRGQPSRYVRMLELRTSGATYDEIAAELHVDESTVRRVIRRLAKRIGE